MSDPGDAEAGLLPTLDQPLEGLAVTVEVMGASARSSLRPTALATAVATSTEGSLRSIFDSTAGGGGESLESVLEGLPALRVQERGGSPAEGAELEVLDELGAGGMGVVERARQRALHRDVAIKRPHPERALARGGAHAGRGAVSTLLREALVTGRLEHPSIVPVHALGVDGHGRPILVMKKIEGVEWAALLEDPAHPRWEKVRGDPLGFHLEVLGRVCHALELAHSRGVIHRDIKPENVMLGPFGEVYLLDWGIATSFAGGASEGGVAGTPAYMAPEMVQRGAALDARTDVYLLGAVLCHVLRGHPPHQGDTFQSVLASITLSEPVALPKEVPSELAAICHRATHRLPEERFQSVEAFRHAVEDFLRHRASHELSDLALARLAELEACALEAGDVEGLIGARRSYDEARFGFREALRIWAGNEAAREGARALAGAMLRVEISAKNAVEARRILEDMEAPSPAQGQALAGLEEELFRERARHAALEREALARDPGVGGGLRAALMFLASVAALALFFLLTASSEEVGGAVSSATYLKVGFAICAAGWLGIGVSLRVVKHPLSRRFFFFLGGLLTLLVAQRMFAVHYGIPPRQAFFFDMILMSTFLLLLVTFVHRRYAKVLLTLVCLPTAFLDLDYFAWFGSVAWVLLSTAWAALVTLELREAKVEAFKDPSSPSGPSP